MKQEMRKLNRVKYASSEEEVKQLAAQGYVPVGTAAAAPPDTASGQMNKKTKQPGAASGRKDKKPAPVQGDSSAEQTAERPEQEGSSAEQTAERPEQEAGMPEQPAADPVPAAADGGGNRT